MDENQDLTIGADGQMNEGEVKSNSQEESADDSSDATTDINKLTPPPEQSQEIQTPVADEKPKTDNEVSIVKSPPADEDALDHEEEPADVVAPPPDNKPPYQQEPEKKKLLEVSDKVAENKTEKQKNTAENRNNKKLAAIVTITFAVLLAAAAVYVYISTQNNAEELKKNTASELEKVNEDDTSTAPEIQQARQEVSEAVNNAEDEAGIEPGSLDNQEITPEGEL